MNKKVWVVKPVDEDRPLVAQLHGMYTIFSSPETARAYQKTIGEETEIVEADLISL